MNQIRRPLDVVILAAGQGTRMKSSRPKVLHEIGGRSMVAWSVKAAIELGARQIVVVTRHEAEQVEQALSAEPVIFARQDEKPGTGRAFQCGVAALQAQPEQADILVLYGDTPLLTTTTLQHMLQEHREQQNAMTVLTARLEDATGYGRIVRNEAGEVVAIVEEKDASAEQKRIQEFNSGVYLFDHQAQQLAEQITNQNAAHEYYLTDLLYLYRTAGAKVQTFCVGSEGEEEVRGANDRKGLAELEAIMRRRINQQHMKNGVTMLAPDTVLIEDSVEIAPDVTLEAGVILKGDTKIQAHSTIGAYSVLTDTHVAEQVNIKPHSVLEGAVVGAHCQVGPFARLRAGSKLAQEVHVGNFVEVKNSDLHAGVKAGHLAYLGDATIGQESNVGAGTIIANFDGVNKHRTNIGAGVFIGSNTVIMAPREIGDAAFIAGGSAIHQDVPQGALAVARGQQRNVEGWSRRYWGQLGEKVERKLPWLAQWLKQS